MMAWFLILVVLLAAFVYRIIACIKKSKQSGEEWNLADKYAANEFGEWVFYWIKVLEQLLKPVE